MSCRVCGPGRGVQLVNESLRKNLQTELCPQASLRTLAGYPAAERKQEFSTTAKKHTTDKMSDQRQGANPDQRGATRRMLRQALPQLSAGGGRVLVSLYDSAEGQKNGQLTAKYKFCACKSTTYTQIWKMSTYA